MGFQIAPKGTPKHMLWRKHIASGKYIAFDDPLDSLEYHTYLSRLTLYGQVEVDGTKYVYVED